MTGFHDKPFDDATQLKLELFRGYIREWLPVFLTQYKEGKSQYRRVDIYDFFAGPGHDAKGNPGSPLIIVEELKQFCQEVEALKASNVSIGVHLNDANAAYVDTLRAEVAKIACQKGCCKIEFTALPFSGALEASLPAIASRDSANLIIMDQFGVKAVTPEIIRKLADCGATDILFFIASMYIRRFIKAPELGGKFAIDAHEMLNTDYNATHRFICEYFRQNLEGTEYFLAPFSIRKGANIHGVIFGSSSLLGLEKFLKVCWKADAVTGEANYNIDGDFSWAGQKSLFSEQNVIRKVDLFAHDLKEFIRSSSPSNRDVFKFCLTKGFRPLQASTILSEMKKNGELQVVDWASGLPARAFYLTWDSYSEHEPRVRFSIRSQL